MKTIKEMIEVMKAYDEGKEIEEAPLRADGGVGNYSSYTGILQFNWEYNDYRIKPAAETRPMTFEEIVAYWKEHRTEIFNLGWEDGAEADVIVGYCKKDNFILLGNSTVSYDQFIRYCTKEDGTKFEVEEGK